MISITNKSWIVMAALVTAACATNPVTGRRELSLISESQEIQMGQQASQQTLQSSPRSRSWHEVARQQRGNAIAKASERPACRGSFTRWMIPR